MKIQMRLILINKKLKKKMCNKINKKYGNKMMY